MSALSKLYQHLDNIRTDDIHNEYLRYNLWRVPIVPSPRRGRGKELKVVLLIMRKSLYNLRSRKHTLLFAVPYCRTVARTMAPTLRTVGSPRVSIGIYSLATLTKGSIP